MESSLFVAAAAQNTLQKQLVVVANNIANSTTVGFRSEIVDFGTLVSRSASPSVSFPTIARLYPSVEEGAKTETGNPLDIALSGQGWFAISTPQGVAYTRDGRLQMNGFGELQSQEGFPVLDLSFAPILIDTRSGPPAITRDGRILVDGKLAGSIGVFEVAPEAFQGRQSNAAFYADTPGIPIAAGGKVSIQQGYLESSNVNPMKELANLITITRLFESTAAVVDRADATISKSINELVQN